MKQASRHQKRAEQDPRAVNNLQGWGAVSEPSRWGQELARHLLVACEDFGVSTNHALKELENILVGVSLLPLLDGLEEEQTSGEVDDLSKVDGLLSLGHRREKGAHMTPLRAAQALVALVDELGEGPIIDPACGHGELLLASQRRWPARNLVGVELHAGLAIAAALRLWKQRREQGGVGQVKILVGDGLARLPEAVGPEGGFALIIGNPPFVGEKGQAAYFRALRQKYPRFEQIYSPRMDLLYLFLARGVELASPGGQQAWLTPPYWLSADGATGLREFLGERVDARAFVELHEPGLFRASPGNELILSVLSRRGEGGARQVWRGKWFRGALDELEKAASEKWREVDPELLSPGGWRPFTPKAVNEWRQHLEQSGTALAELVRDFQGFVSGADRVTRRHLAILKEGEARFGEPIFLAEGSQIPKAWRGVPKKWVRPVLRSRELKPNHIFYRGPANAWALYIDDEVVNTSEEAQFHELLGRFRPILERRREVQRGLIPWYRLHWPRDRRAMEGPKLVVPRRSAEPCFSLDLSGAMVSSDCTFLVAPEGVTDPIRYLARLMLLLNSPEIGRFLHYFGKRKGRLLEFYSSPLRQIVVPAHLENGELILAEKLFDEAQRQRFWEQLQGLFEDAPARESAPT